MKESKHGGQRIGAGRPKSERPLVKHTVYLYKDQLPISSALLRQYIDDLKRQRAPLIHEIRKYIWDTHIEKDFL